jgi:hypothetical protein
VAPQLLPRYVGTKHGEAATVIIYDTTGRTSPNALAAALAHAVAGPSAHVRLCSMQLHTAPRVFHYIVIYDGKVAPGTLAHLAELISASAWCVSVHARATPTGGTSQTWSYSRLQTAASDTTLGPLENAQLVVATLGDRAQQLAQADGSARPTVQQLREQTSLLAVTAERLYADARRALEQRDDLATVQLTISPPVPTEEDAWVIVPRILSSVVADRRPQEVAPDALDFIAVRRKYGDNLGVYTARLPRAYADVVVNGASGLRAVSQHNHLRQPITLVRAIVASDRVAASSSDSAPATNANGSSQSV